MIIIYNIVDSDMQTEKKIRESEIRMCSFVLLAHDGIEVFLCIYIYIVHGKSLTFAFDVF